MSFFMIYIDNLHRLVIGNRRLSTKRVSIITVYRIVFLSKGFFFTFLSTSLKSLLNIVQEKCLPIKVNFFNFFTSYSNVLKMLLLVVKIIFCFHVVANPPTYGSCDSFIASQLCRKFPRSRKNLLFVGLQCCLT